MYRGSGTVQRVLVGQFQPVDLASIFDFVEPFLNLFLYYRENDVNTDIFMKILLITLNHDLAPPAFHLRAAQNCCSNHSRQQST